MNFDVAKAIRKSTGRAKSDVANKLVSMLLHEMSRKVSLSIGMTVYDPEYSKSVENAFGDCCLYCGCQLERDRAAVEHLNGMNRFQLGLHIPGNVAMACKTCNNQKRRDDQNPSLSVDGYGWESFLSHDGTRCEGACKTCDYWSNLIPGQADRKRALGLAKIRVHDFQKPFHKYLSKSSDSRENIRTKVETLYRDCQSFATNEIERLTGELDT